MTTTVPPQVLAEWRSAEERLYPVVMLRPDLYQRSIELVRRVADELAANCPDVDALVAAWPEATDLVYRVSSLALLPLGDLDVSLVAGAAFCLRYREVAMAVARSERLERVRAAAAAGGAAWVEIEETGTLAAAAFMPFTRLEMHLPSGLGLRRSLGADPDTGRPVFGLETLLLDPSTGDLLEPAGGVPEEFETRGDWEAAIERRRREIEAGT